jgi:hypothetical protein
LKIARLAQKWHLQFDFQLIIGKIPENSRLAKVHKRIHGLIFLQCRICQSELGAHGSVGNGYILAKMVIWVQISI